MSLKYIIKKVLKEETEEWVDVEPEEYNDLLKYVNGDGSLIKRLPQYRGKKINITGDLTIDDDVTNIDSIDYVTGDLDLGGSEVPYFDKSKVKDSLHYYRSKMYKLEREKALKQKREYLNELREEGAWDIENGEDDSYYSEAVFDHLKSVGVVEEGEDKYYLYKERYTHYGGRFFTWLGSDKFESEWAVYRDDEIHDAAYESLESRIEELGIDAFYLDTWEDHLDMNHVRNWLHDDYEEVVRDSPEDWNIPKELTQQQERYIEIYEKKVSDLNNKLNDSSLSEEQIEEIENQISDTEDIIEDIKENPEGDYSETAIEDTIEGLVDDAADDFPRHIRNRGYERSFILDFVDMDSVIEYVIRSDGYGNILNGYDGGDDEYKVDGRWYHVMRHN